MEPRRNGVEGKKGEILSVSFGGCQDREHLSPYFIGKA